MALPLEPDEPLSEPVLSPSGRYTFQVDRAGEGTVFVQDERSGAEAARITLNPGGGLSGSARVEWVAGDRILFAQGCGTGCYWFKVYAPDGSEVASGAVPTVSPDGRWILSTPDFAGPSCFVRLLDLATGETVVERTLAASSGEEQWCSVSSQETRFTASGVELMVTFGYEARRRERVLLRRD